MMVATKIAMIACKWHPLTAMENAARDGFTCGPDVGLLPVKCGGMVTVALLLKLFAKGVDGVLVLGCAEGDCHYYNGGERCRAIVEETRAILEISGIAKQRLGFRQVADGAAKEFERALKDFLKQMKRTGGGKKQVASASSR